MEDKKGTGAIAKRSSKNSIEEAVFWPSLAKKLLNLIKKKATDLEIIEFLNTKADVNAVDEAGKTALHHVVIWGLKEITTWLMEMNANINAADKEGKTPLHYAAVWGLVEISELLLEGSKVDINCLDETGKTPLHYAVISPCSDLAEELTELLIANAAKIDVLDKKGKTPLYYAVTHNNIAVAKQLVSTILLENTNTTKPDYIYEAGALSEFWDTYLAEVKGMVEEKKSGSRFSVYAFYTRDIDELAVTMTKKEFEGFKCCFNRPDFVRKLPTFSAYLTNKLEELAKLKDERDNLLVLSSKCKISSSISPEGASTDLNKDAQRNVLGYLSTAEIKKVLAASFYPPVSSLAVETSHADFNASVASRLK